MDLHGPDATQWDTTIQAEVDAVNQNKIGTLVPCPEIEKSLGNGFYQEN